MAIKFVKSLSGESCSTIETRPTTANTAIAEDTAVTLTAGKVAVATGKPMFVSASATASTAAPKATAVYPVLPQHIYETTFSAAATAVNTGDKVTLAASGAEVTATTTGGVATVWAMFGTAVGSKVWVRFE